MRRSTSAITERGNPAQLPPPLEGPPVLGRAVSEELDLLGRTAAARTGALTGLPVICRAACCELEEICACGTATSEGGQSRPAMEPGIVGRVLASEHTACEPIRARFCAGPHKSFVIHPLPELVIE